MSRVKVIKLKNVSEEYSAFLVFFAVKLNFYFHVCDFYNRIGKTIGVAY